MKKLNTLWIMLFAFLAMNFVMTAAPNLTIDKGDTEVSGGVNDDLEIHGIVRNNSKVTSVITMLKVYLHERQEGQSLMICWGEQCLPPISDVGLTKFSERVPIMVQSTSGNKFHCTVDQGGVEGDMVATFVFYDANNPNDSAAFTTHVHIGPTDVEEITVNTLGISPNPASDFINVNFDSDASTIKIFDITGILLNSFNVESGTHSLNINMSTIPSGVYLLNIINRDGTMQTRRFVISK
jgi:hypothetical protein